MALHHYLIGNMVNLVATFAVRDPLSGDLTPTDPTTVSFLYDVDAGLDVGPAIFPGSPDISNPAVGTFVYELTPAAAGKYRVRVESTGACVAAAEHAFEVDASTL